MKRYWKQALPDALLCTALTVSLVPAVCSGFVLCDPFSASTAFIALCSLAVQLLFALLARRKAAVRLGIGLGAAIAVGIFVCLRLRGPLAGETAESAFLFALIELITALLVFLLGRSRPGIAALFLAGSWLCAGCRFLQFPASGWCLYLFLAAAAALYLLRVCTVCAARAELGGEALAGRILQPLLLAAAALAAAAGLYFGVIAPLHPPTRELKLITELRSMELLQVLGVATTETVLDPELSSDAPPEETEQTDKRGDTPSDAPDGLDDTLPDAQPDPGETLAETISSALQEAAEAIRYDETLRSRLWLLLLLPAALAAAYVLRLALHRRWRRRVRALPREDAVWNYYRFFLSRLARAGLKRPPERTLREYAADCRTRLEPFETCGVTFAELTAVCERVLYGSGSVSEEEYARFERFYDGLSPALRRELGPVKYYLRAFRF